jgi:hypothetical protein
MRQNFGLRWTRVASSTLARNMRMDVTESEYVRAPSPPHPHPHPQKSLFDKGTLAGAHREGERTTHAYT